MLTTYLVDSSHMKSFPSLWLFLLFHTHHHTGRVQLRHDTCEGDRSITPDSLLWFRVRYSQGNQFHNLPRTRSIHLTQKTFLETSGNIVDLLECLIISLTTVSSGQLTLLSLILAPACNTKLIDLCIAPVQCELLVSFS